MAINQVDDAKRNRPDFLSSCLKDTTAVDLFILNTNCEAISTHFFLRYSCRKLFRDRCELDGQWALVSTFELLLEGGH